MCIRDRLSQEQVEDYVGGMLDGTETLISVSYDTVDNNLDFVVENDLSQYDNTTSAFITLTSLSGSTGVTYDNSTGAISIGQAVGTTSDVTFNDVTISGDLTVSGTTTTVNTETIALADNQIVLNSNYSGNAPTENGGIEINRGGGTAPNKTLVWNETDDKWTVGSETFVAGTFEGALTGNVTGDVTGDVTGNLTGDVTGNADTATQLETARTIGGVSFDGTANIDLPGVNTTGNQNTSGSAATLTTARDFSLTGDVTASAVSFDGSGAVALSTTIASGAVDFAMIADTIDEDDMTSDSATKLPTQQSVKAYVDAQVATKDALSELSGDSDDITEGTTNRYFTDARADARISAADLQDLSNVGFSAPGASDDAKVVSWDNTAGAFALSSLSGLSGSGETNTASNIGTAGVGIFLSLIHI